MKWLVNSALFPREASTVAPWADGLYFFLLLHDDHGPFAGWGAGVRVLGPLSQGEVHPVATQIEGSTLLEATWTIIPLAIFLVTFVWGALLYFRIYNPPANAMNVYIVGKQWMWKAEHPGGQHEINALHVPIGRPVQLTMISQDVFHSFSIPDFPREARGDSGALLDGVVRGDGDRARFTSSARNTAGRSTRA